MSTKNTILTEKETHILKMLAGGLTNPQIQKALHISAPSLHVHCHRIRQKTGIMDTKNQRQCRQFLETVHPRSCTPTGKQMDVLRLLASGKTHRYISQSLGISVSSSMNHASQGIRRLGITARKERRMEMVRAIIASMDGADAYDLMSDKMFN